MAMPMRVLYTSAIRPAIIATDSRMMAICTLVMVALVSEAVK